jgi:hypothetical protein
VVQRLGAEQERGPQTHQSHASAEKIPHRPAFGIVDVASRQDPKSEQLGQKVRIILVVGVLDAFVLVDLGRIGQDHRESGGLEPIDQPVPVEGRLHGDPVQKRLVRIEEGDDLLQVAGEPAVSESRSIRIDDANHHVVAMQVHPGHHSLHRSPFGLGCCRCLLH